MSCDKWLFNNIIPKKRKQKSATHHPYLGGVFLAKSRIDHLPGVPAVGHHLNFSADSPFGPFETSMGPIDSPAEFPGKRHGKVIAGNQLIPAPSCSYFSVGKASNFNTYHKLFTSI